MIKIYSKLFFILPLLLFLACQDESPELIAPDKSEVIFLEDNIHLQNLVNQINVSTINGRSNSLLDDVDFNKAIVTVDEESGLTSYTFSMFTENRAALRKFILAENQQQQIEGYVYEYELDVDWYNSLDSFPGWDQYNGYFRILNLDGDVFAENTIVDGESLFNNNTNGRTSGYTCITYTVRVGWICVGGGCSPKYETVTDCFLNATSGGGGGSSNFATNENFTYPERVSLELDLNLNDLGTLPPSCPYGKDESGNCLSEVESWEQNVCTTNAFDNNPCLASVWNKLKSTNAAASLLDKFENSSWIDLCVDASLSSSANAQTSLSGSNATINFNTSKLGRSQLSIARTFLHEMVHAELFRKVKSVGGTFSQNDFPGIYDYFRRYYKNWQHQQMAAHYINTIANGLSQFDGGSHQLSYYKDIAWIGLWKVPNYNTADPNDFIETQAWKDLSTSEQNRIKNAVANFQSTENTNCQ